MRELDLVLEEHEAHDQEIYVTSVCGTDNNRAIFGFIQFLYFFQSCMIDHHFFIDSSPHFSKKPGKYLDHF